MTYNLRMTHAEHMRRQAASLRVAEQQHQYHVEDLQKQLDARDQLVAELQRRLDVAEERIHNLLNPDRGYEWPSDGWKDDDNEA